MKIPAMDEQAATNIRRDRRRTRLLKQRNRQAAARVQQEIVKAVEKAREQRG